MSPSTSKPPTKSYFGDQSPYNPSPIHVDRPQEVDSSPYSWSSHASQNGLIQSPSPTTVKSVSNLRESSTASQHGPTVVSSQPMPASSSNSLSHRPRMARPPSGSGAGLRRSSAYSSSRDSELWQDEDARLVKDSVNASRRLNRQSASLSPYQDHPETFAQPTSSLPTSSAFSHPQSASVGSQQKIGLKDGQRSSATLFDSDDQEFQSSRSRLESSQSTPRARQPVLFHEGGPSSFQTSPTSAKFAVPLRQAIPSTSKTMPNVRNKVMTPAQFNEYKREQEMSRISSDATLSEDSDDENENYEDDDETERNRQLARQRRKQEADLAVYRQQMMKVTGEQPSDLPNIGQPRVGTDRETMSTPDLTGRYATPTFSFDKPSEKTKGSDDEDDDVPLGILAAHGFPNKNRPPSTYSNVGSNPYIRYNSESYPPPPMSTAGASNETGKRLPPFARNLPPDPYYGAGLVNSSNREPPSFGNTAGGSVHGGPSQNLPPGGLVGVIAGEERARAMRRGSPNAQGNYGSPLPQGMPQMPMGMPPGMPTMPMMSPGDEAQIQVSQQMSHMMQLQLEWMQQMQNLVSGNIQQGQLPQLMQAQQQMMNHGYLSPPGQVSRPTSMASYSGPGTPALGQQAQQRAMSMMDPGTGQHLQSNGAVRMVAPSVMSGALGGQGYTHSIAPSERSNVGMPSRYRPVSIAPVDEAPRPNSRASTLMSGHLQIGNDRRSHMLSTTKPVPSTRQKARQKGITASDDDDEEGWEEMKKNREKKKSSWRTKKNEQDDIQDLYYPEAHDVL